MVRVYLPPDANCLLYVGDHCLRAATRERHRRGQAAGAAVARRRCGGSATAGAASGIWPWASNDEDGEPDVVLACAGDVPTLETLARRRSCASTCRT
jgi:xylulose-5-phosphate/fructose-6-phosphate phosphoketolase